VIFANDVRFIAARVIAGTCTVGRRVNGRRAARADASVRVLAFLKDHLETN
jgi:hypothetical protein